MSHRNACLGFCSSKKVENHGSSCFLQKRIVIPVILDAEIVNNFWIKLGTNVGRKD